MFCGISRWRATSPAGSPSGSWRTSRRKISSRVDCDRALSAAMAEFVSIYLAFQIYGYKSRYPIKQTEIMTVDFLNFAAQIRHLAYLPKPPINSPTVTVWLFLIAHHCLYQSIILSDSSHSSEAAIGHGSQFTSGRTAIMTARSIIGTMSALNPAARPVGR